MREEYILKKLSDFLKRTRFLFRVLVSRVNPSLSWPRVGPGAPACLSAPLPLAYSKACWSISRLDKPSDILTTCQACKDSESFPSLHSLLQCYLKIYSSKTEAKPKKERENRFTKHWNEPRSAMNRNARGP